PEPSDPGPRAAYFTARHAGTPTIQHLDVLGRAVVSVAHNRRRRHDPDGAVRYEDEFIPTRTELDVEGNPLAIYDGRRCEGLTREQALTHRGNRVMLYRYAMGGLAIHQDSMDAGRRWTLANVAGNPAYTWDDRGHRVRTRYDALQRPTHVIVDSPRDDGTTHTITAERIVYGEELPDAAARAANLRGRIHLHFDGAGLVKNAAFDFKGNLIAAERRLAADYRDTPDWSALDGLPVDALEAAAPLAAETFATFTTYDALDRPTSVETPDGSVHLPSYNKANLLDGVRVRLRGASTATAFVETIEYNARG